jgi:hypothetical protein
LTFRRRKVRFTPFPAIAENCVSLPCSSSIDSNPLRWALNRGTGDMRDYSKLGSQIIILRIMQAFFEMSFFEIVLECLSILYPMHFSMHQIVPQLLLKVRVRETCFAFFTLPLCCLACLHTFIIQFSRYKCLSKKTCVGADCTSLHPPCGRYPFRFVAPPLSNQTRFAGL